MAKNTHLNQAKKEKNDEFYTRYEDIEKELINYDKKYFKDKTVYLPCDDLWSNFWKYFTDHFREYGLKKLIASHYEKGAETVNVYIYDGEKVSETELNGDGDFRSKECVELLNEADIVCTNVPFSLFREFVTLMEKHNKKYLIIGNKNAVAYKEIFPLIKNNKMWIGNRPMNSDFWLRVPNGNTYEKECNGIHLKHIMACWFTNLDIPKRHEDLILIEKYTPEKYPKYDSFDAINVDKTVDIPCDFAGIMGVPITFLDKYNPEQFDLIGVFSNPIINGQRKFKRILIQKKRAV